MKATNKFPVEVSVSHATQAGLGSGHFDYNPNRIGYTADEVEELIASNNDDSINSWGDTVGRFYSEETIAEFRNGLHYLRLAQIYAQRIDCLVICDDGEESFHSRLREELENVKIRSE